ncbi:hypothetical protein [Streptomyces roseolus]|uniref:hypothetical protein n=1 Tax=Streptomyces roseolus TaxID=67358 RepID=UPI00167A372A|nr:hypothetical protein [Streptomyces roseolus]GGR27064.1 hypothetical protein GCM10010282_19340 [Streptomyces roseolus]
MRRTAVPFLAGALPAGAVALPATAQAEPRDVSAGVPRPVVFVHGRNAGPACGGRRRSA